MSIQGIGSPYKELFLELFLECIYNYVESRFTSTFSFLVLVATWKVPCEATMRQSSKMKQPPNVVAMLRESSQPGNNYYVFVHTPASYLLCCMCIYVLLA